MKSSETCLYGKPINKTTYKDIDLLISFVRGATGEEELRIYAALLTNACEAFGVAPPDIEKIRHSINLKSREASAILKKIDAFIDEHPEFNHHTKPQLIAVNTKQLEALGISISRNDLKMVRGHPRFRSIGTVNSRVQKKPVHCLVVAR